MMHWQDNIDEKKQQQWQSRVTRERLDLSASVEEALIDESAQEVLEAEEFDEFVPYVQKAMLIPPCLSIQSKQLPAVRTLPKARTDHLPIATKEGKMISACLWQRTNGRQLFGLNAEARWNEHGFLHIRYKFIKLFRFQDFLSRFVDQCLFYRS